MLRKGAYIIPHKHRHKAESCTVVAGRLDVVVFDDAGKIKDVMQLGDYASGRPFFYRRRDRKLLFIQLSFALRLAFHETTNGPFVKSRSTLPGALGRERVRSGLNFFLKKLNVSISKFLAVRSRRVRAVAAGAIR